MPAPYRHVSLSDRRIIFRMIHENRPIRQIADAIGRHCSTVYREIGRNKIQPERDNRPFRYFDYHRREGYYPVSADNLARQRRQRQRKLVARPDLRRHVLDRLRAAWSPQQIAGRLALEESPLGRVCHETIYQYAYSEEGRVAGVARLLPQARKQRRPRFGRKPRQSPIPPALAIENRPERIGKREEFGHWEGDLMIFRRDLGKANIATIIERQTRYTLLLRNPDRRARPLADAIITSLQPLPAKARQSITFDRGTEFAAYRHLDVQAWFCDPHSPWQKGAVENANGRVRRFLPSQTDIAALPTIGHRRAHQAAQRHATKMPRIPDTRRSLPTTTRHHP